MTGGVETFPWTPGDLWAGRAMVLKSKLPVHDCDPAELVELLVIHDPEKGEGIGLHPKTKRVLVRELRTGDFVWKHDRPTPCTINGLGAAIQVALAGSEMSVAEPAAYVPPDFSTWGVKP